MATKMEMMKKLDELALAMGSLGGTTDDVLEAGKVHAELRAMIDATVGG